MCQRLLVRDQNAGVRRHRQPHPRLQRCEHRQYPYTSVLKAKLHKQLRAESARLVQA